MRTSSNPAFRNLPTGRGGYTGFDDRIGGAAGGAAAYRQANQPTGFDRSTTDRPLTVDDVVTKGRTLLAAASRLVSQGDAHLLGRPGSGTAAVVGASSFCNVPTRDRHDKNAARTVRTLH